MPSAGQELPRAEPPSPGIHPMGALPHQGLLPWCPPAEPLVSQQLSGEWAAGPWGGSSRVHPGLQASSWAPEGADGAPCGEEPHPAFPHHPWGAGPGRGVPLDGTRGCPTGRYLRRSSWAPAQSPRRRRTRSLPPRWCRCRSHRDCQWSTRPCLGSTAACGGGGWGRAGLGSCRESSQTVPAEPAGKGRGGRAVIPSRHTPTAIHRLWSEGDGAGGSRAPMQTPTDPHRASPTQLTPV